MILKKFALRKLSHNTCEFVTSVFVIIVLILFSIIDALFNPTKNENKSQQSTLEFSTSVGEVRECIAIAKEGKNCQAGYEVAAYSPQFCVPIGSVNQSDPDCASHDHAHSHGAGILETHSLHMVLILFLIYCLSLSFEEFMHRTMHWIEHKCTHGNYISFKNLKYEIIHVGIIAIAIAFLETYIIDNLCMSEQTTTLYYEKYRVIEKYCQGKKERDLTAKIWTYLIFAGTHLYEDFQSRTIAPEPYEQCKNLQENELLCNIGTDKFFPRWLSCNSWYGDLQQQNSHLNANFNVTYKSYSVPSFRDIWSVGLGSCSSDGTAEEHPRRVPVVDAHIQTTVQYIVFLLASLNLFAAIFFIQCVKARIKYKHVEGFSLLQKFIFMFRCNKISQVNSETRNTIHCKSKGTTIVNEVEIRQLAREKSGATVYYISWILEDFLYICSFGSPLGHAHHHVKLSDYLLPSFSIHHKELDIVDLAEAKASMEFFHEQAKKAGYESDNSFSSDSENDDMYLYGIGKDEKDTEMIELPNVSASSVEIDSSTNSSVKVKKTENYSKKSLLRQKLVTMRKETRRLVYLLKVMDSK
eukprot:g5267.t1